MRESKYLLMLFVISFVGSSSLITVQSCWAQSSTHTPPDNSAVNARDRNPQAVTADQQSNRSGDVELTQKIRRAVVKDSSLSTMAHNVKIVAENGSVTLRGPVENEHERAVVARKAKAIAGAGKVDNELEVKNTQ